MSMESAFALFASSLYCYCYPAVVTILFVICVARLCYVDILLLNT